jgi:hypothetical protein
MTETIPKIFTPTNKNLTKRFLKSVLIKNVDKSSNTIKNINSLTKEQLLEKYNNVFNYKNFIWFYLIEHPEELQELIITSGLNITQLKKQIKNSKIKGNPKWFRRLSNYIERVDNLPGDAYILERINNYSNYYLHDKTIKSKTKIDYLLTIFRRAKDIVYNYDNKKHLIINIYDDKTNELLRVYTLSSKFSNKLRNLLEKLLFGEDISEAEPGSDTKLLNYIQLPNRVYFNFELKDKKNISSGGGFFNFANFTDIDLKDLQIYTEEQLLDTNPDFIKERNENCLIFTLRKCGISEDKINELKLSIFSDYVLKRNLKKVADIINKKIIVNITESKGRNRKRTYGNYKESVEIILFKDHYFANIDVDITTYAIRNYEAVKHIKIWNHIINHLHKKSRAKTIKAHRAIPMMYKHGLLKRSNLLTEIEKSNYICPNLNDILDNIDNEQEKMKFRPIINNKEVVVDGETLYVPKVKAIFYADYETIQHNGIQKAFSIGFTYENITKTFYNYTLEDIEYNNAFTNCINAIAEIGKEADDIIIYFHNLKFDFNFIEKFCYMKKIVKKSSNIWSASFNWNLPDKQNIKIEVRDSYKIISSPLSKFQREFELDIGKKDFIAYKFFNIKTINQITTNLEYYWDALIKEFPDKADSYEEFLEVNKEFIKERNGKLRLFHMRMMDDYLKLDCQTLSQGFMKFAQIMKEGLRLNVYNFLSSASLADYYLKRENCYKNIYAIKGNLRNFIMKAMVGGRVATRHNKKIVIDGKIDDFDAVSLYPSAMKRLKEDSFGLPAGKAKLVQDLDNIDVFDNNYRIYKINITAINKHQQIAFINKNTDNGRIYDNNLLGVHYVDSITLQDYINFHQIEYEIITAIEWTKYNTKISTVIETLFNLRLKAKAEGKNILQGLYKLIMNSAYGKTLLKPSKSDYIYVKEADLDKYISNHYNDTIEMVKVGKQYRIKKYANRYNHFNRAHCGIIILSMSKRIMNEVMNTAQDNSIKIYYQDTDSMHLNSDDVDKLADYYRNIYNKELIGKNMGQFHSDFELDGAGGNVWSEKCIILGKKCYLDVLKSDNGKTGYHIRMKGVGENVIKRHAIDNDISAEEIYLSLLNDNKIAFDLCKGGIKFEQKANSISLKEEFVREIKFIGEYQEF